MGLVALGSGESIDTALKLAEAGMTRCTRPARASTGDIPTRTGG
jgi:hypothetical protein